MMSQLLDMLKFYTGFEINDQTGNALTENEMTTIHYDRITSLQVGRWQSAYERERIWFCWFSLICICNRH